MRDFTLWLFESLECECTCDEDAVVVTLPDSLATTLGCNTSLRLVFCDAHDTEATQLITINSTLLRTLVDELKSAQSIGFAVPRRQPESVRDVSQILFDEYTVDNGSVHLGGCTLEDRFLLRVSYVHRSSDAEVRIRLQHQFLDLTGVPVEEALVERLGLRALVVPTRTVRATSKQRERWQRIGEAAIQNLKAADDVEFLVVTAVSCKYAEGKLVFVIGDASTSIAFSGWAQLFVDGSEKPPALTCSCCETASYHVAATDGGEIVPHEAIAVCAESGQRVLTSELTLCVATGKKVLAEFLTTCPVSGERVLEKALVACDTCQQLVSPTACEANRCNACRSLTKVSKNDPRMARLLGEYPGLDRWNRWEMSETATVYVLVARSLTKRLLIVAQKDDLAILRLAKSAPFAKKWTDAPDVDRSTHLR
jgi:hypothetical protein